MNSTTAKPGLLTRWKMLTEHNSIYSTALVFCFMLLLQACVTLAYGGSLGLTWLNILRNNVYTGVIALGMCFVIISGGIDISVGSMMCALGAILMYLIEPNTGLLASLGLNGASAYVLGIVMTVIAGCILGGFNGVLISYGRMPAFIVTLGTMKIFRSVTQQLTSTFNPTVPNGFKAISSKSIGGAVILPILYWVVIVAVCVVVFNKTAFGKQCVAIGSAEHAARLSGINVRLKKLLIYIISGVSCAIAAVLFVSRIGAMDFANAGNGYEMDAIAAVIVGGTSMNGGKGNLLGAFIGMLIIGLMNNILNSIGIPTFLCEAVKGSIIIIAVLMQKKER